MAQLQAQPSINDARAKAHLALGARLAQLDLTPMLVYRLDSCPDSALVFLAWQFDVLDPEWQLGASGLGGLDELTAIDPLTNIDMLTGGGAGASDYDAWRALLAEAIPLHRTRGTPSAIASALAALGWASVAFLEGQASWGGNSWPSNEGWAAFRVLINLGALDAVGADDAARALAAVNFFKPARCWLDSLWFVAPPVSDAAPAPADFTGLVDNAPAPADVITAPIPPVSDNYGPVVPLYNKHYYHAGITYGAGEPTVADSGVTVNGQAISANG